MMPQEIPLDEVVFRESIGWGDPTTWRSAGDVVTTSTGQPVPAQVVLNLIALLRRDKNDMYGSHHTTFFRAKCGRMAERGIICPCGVDHSA